MNERYWIKFYVCLEKIIKSDDILKTENISCVIYFNAFIKILDNVLFFNRHIKFRYLKKYIFMYVYIEKKNGKFV